MYLSGSGSDRLVLVARVVMRERRQAAHNGASQLAALGSLVGKKEKGVDWTLPCSSMVSSNHGRLRRSV